MGHALTGVADDASAVYYNPAGLVLNNTKKWEGEAYIYFNFVGFEYEDNSKPAPTTDKADLFYYVPGFFLCRRFERVALGCGFYVPYGGGGVDYENFQGSGFRFQYLAGFSAFTPAAAFKVTDNFSVGAGLSLYYGQMESDMFDPAYASVVTSKYQRILAGCGGHVSLFYKPVEALGLGFTARSKVPVKMGGDIEVLSSGTRLDSEVEFTLPYAFSVGVGYKPGPKMTLGLTCNTILWGEMDEITFTTAGIENVSNTHYRNSVLVGLGMEYWLKDRLALRTGFKYAQGATENQGLTFASNDVDLLVFSVGAGFAIKGSMEIDINTGYTYGLEKEYQSRTYDLDTFIVLIGMRWKR